MRKAPSPGRSRRGRGNLNWLGAEQFSWTKLAKCLCLYRPSCFLQRFSRQIGKKLKGVEPEAFVAMKDYPWPGNIRELQNVMERGVILAQDFIRLSNLPDQILHNNVQETRESKDVLKSVEKEMIVKALRKHGENRRLAATDLGISRRTLQYKLKEFALLDDI